MYEMVVLIIIVLGLALGSFINAFVWRIKKKKDWVKGRSVCVHCGHQLQSADLIPVFSWLLLRGRCRYCHKPISWQYPVVELLTAGLFIISYLYWPYSFGAVGIIRFCFWLIFLTGLISLAIYDIKWMRLPNIMIFPLIWLALSQSVFLVIVADSAVKQLISLGLSILIGFGIFYALFQVSSGKWIGGGDVKLGGLLALIIASPGLMALTIFLASLLGTSYSLPLMLSGKLKRSSRIPFGPFLIAGALIAMLFGDSLLKWYKRKILLV